MERALVRVWYLLWDVPGLTRGRMGANLQKRVVMHGGTIASGEHAKIGTRVAAMVLGAVGNVQEHVASTSQGTTLTAPLAADDMTFLRWSFEVGLYFCSVLSCGVGPHFSSDFCF